MSTEHTCGKCGRVVIITPLSGDVSVERMIATALFCPKCDDIFCLGCGSLKMPDSGRDVPCGNCGGNAKELNEVNRPSWYPGQRPIKERTYKIGERIANIYEIYKILGGKEGHGGVKSGMGVVYVCYNHEDKEIVALKTFQDKYMFSKEMKENFKKEALTWIQLEKHPHIVKANYVRELDYRIFVACEFIAPDSKGRNTLTHYLKNSISLKQAIKWSIQFCYGMEHSFLKGVTPHRDIKSDNIMITKDGVLKITDFGLSGLWENVDEDMWGELKYLMDENSRRFSFLGIDKGRMVCGTPPWMAPEQFHGEADVRSDIYGFGIVMYQIATRGNLPFFPGNGDDWEIAHKQYPIPQLDSKLFPFIERCLKKNLDERYSRFEELRKDLEVLYKREMREDPPVAPNKIELESWEHVNKGVSLNFFNFHDEAIKEYKEALRIDPEIIEAYVNLGTALMDKGLHDDAINEYREALRIGSDCAVAHFGLGNVLLDKCLYDEAIKEYIAALRINPEDAKYHNGLGNVYKAKDLYDEAIKEYKEALRINPEYSEACNNLGSTLTVKGLFDEAIKVYKEALRINPENAEAHYNIGNTLKSKGLLDEAIKEYKEAMRINPEQESIYYNLGYLFAEKGQLDEAIKAYRNAIRVNPKFTKAHHNLGNILHDKGLFDDAINEYTEALRIEPDYAVAHFSLGNAFLNKELYDEAIKEYRDVVRINPVDLDSRSNLGFALEKKGLLDAAIKEYKDALKINPQYEVAHINLGYALEDKGLYDEAIKSFENFIKYAPPQYTNHIEKVKEAIIQLKGQR